MKKLVALAVMLAVMLALALPASAETASVGNLIADAPAGQGFGTDIAVAGNPVPPNPFALGVNDPFTVNFALGGVGPVEDDVIAGSEFLGTNFVEAGSGNLSVDTEDNFFD